MSKQQEAKFFNETTQKFLCVVPWCVKYQKPSAAKNSAPSAALVNLLHSIVELPFV